MKNTANLEKKAQQHPVLLCAILSYNNPLHHPTPEFQVWAMSSNRPINYRSEIEPKEDQRIREDQGAKHDGKEDEKEIDKPEKEDENIPVPNTEEGDPQDLPDTEDPNEAKDDVDQI